VKRRTRTFGPAVLLVAVLALAACSSGSGGSSAAKPSSSRVVTVPPEVKRYSADWPLPARDYDNSRAQPDATITTRNVAQLRQVWSTPMPGAAAFGNLSSAPVILGDTVYVQDLNSNLKAIDLATGAVKWSKDNHAFSTGPNGPVVGYGNVYVAKSGRGIGAFDAKDGHEVWSTELATTPTEGIDIQPTVVDGLVLAATVPISLQGQFKGGDRGVLWALDAKTGKKVWSFDTVKSDDLWGHPEINSGGGAWFAPAVDRKRALVFWGIANPAPFPGVPGYPKGSSRPGANLYTESVVALHLQTGKLAWYHQAVPHDLFDHDLQLTAIAHAGGKDLVIGTGKLGRVIALDPGTGKVVSNRAVGIHQNDDPAALTRPIDVMPGLFGGTETPVAVADGVVYSAVVNAPSHFEPAKQDFFGGAKMGQLPGQVVATEAATGRVIWDTTIEGDPLGGALVMADLVFVGTYQGKIYALDRSTGSVVRTIDAPGGINAWPAATKDTIVWPIGMAKPPAVVALRVH
jgi:outer membrane protein assembly factor BamB